MSKNDFNATINLPKTDFPMRAGLAKREPEMLQRWYDMDLYHEMLKKNDGKPRFSLHDGPPFSNGDIHMGHALNKALKDFIVRSYAMRGYYTPYIPGWDNHGMPIESAIIKEQKLNRKAMSIADFRSACHDYAQKYIDRQMAGFKRMGVMGDWEHPYKTMNKGFEADEVRVFGKMYQNGHIYKGLKPVYWCPHDETALAEAEIEYQDDPCTTVYVKFPMHDDLGKLPNARPQQALLRHLDDHDLDPARQPRHLRCNPRELLRPSCKAPQRRGVHHGRGPDREGHAHRRL